MRRRGERLLHVDVNAQVHGCQRDGGVHVVGRGDRHRLELAAELEKAILPFLTSELVSRADGHCMRVSDLDLDLMLRLCDGLQKAVPTARTVILTDGQIVGVPPAMAVTSTKLVELRNPNPDGSQKSPLLVFVPSGLRASAEDSFGIATFEEINLGGVYGRLKTDLLGFVPSMNRGALTEGLARLAAEANPWPYIDDASVVRYLLTGKCNGGDSEAYGGALFEIGLIPDFELFVDPAKVPQRLVRNRDSVSKIT